MDPISGAAIISSFTALIIVIYTQWNSKRKLKDEHKLLKLEMNNQDLNKSNANLEVSLSKIEHLKVGEITEEIQNHEINALKVFYESNKTKVDMMEIAGLIIPYQAYYNFSVYKAFVEKSPHEGKYYIDKITDYESKNKIPITRWKARINRLCANEGEASKLLSELIIHYKNEKNQVGLSRVYRSRGFSHLNMHHFDLALKDFESSIKLPDTSKVEKTTYSIIGAAICYANQNDDTMAKKLLSEGQKREELFKADNIKEFDNNIRLLRNKKKYFITSYEKSQLLKLLELDFD